MPQLQVWHLWQASLSAASVMQRSIFRFVHFTQYANTIITVSFVFQCKYFCTFYVEAVSPYEVILLRKPPDPLEGESVRGTEELLSVRLSWSPG